MAHNGFKMVDGELQIQFGSSEQIAFDGTGLSFHGVAPVAQSAAIADVSVTGTYATDDTPIETAINSIIAALEAHGIIAT